MKTNKLSLKAPKLPVSEPGDPNLLLSVSDVTFDSCRITWGVHNYRWGAKLYKDWVFVDESISGGDNYFTGLESNKRYWFNLVPNDGPDAPESKALLVTTSRRKPTPPSFFEAYNQTASEVSLVWGRGAVDGGVAGYELRRDGDFLEALSDPPYTDTTPQQGRVHKYCMRTYDEVFNFSDPVCVEVEFEGFTAPTAPPL